MTQRFLQQGEGPDDIGLDELGGTVDRAVDMALGGEIHHAVRRVRLEQPPQLGSIADVDAGEAIAGVVRGLRNRVQIRGVGELVDIDDAGLGLVEQMPDHRRADKAGAAGDKDCGPAKPHAIRAPSTATGRMSGEC